MKDNWLTSSPIAHRGITNQKEGILENSIESVKLCLKYNIPIEIDVRMTKENEIILLHDNYVIFNSNTKKHYKNITNNDINNKCILNSNCKIATLKQTLETIEGKIPILIEPKIEKNKKKMKAFIEELEQILNTYNGPYAIHSFHFNIHKLFKNNKIKKGIIIPMLNTLPTFLKNLLNKAILNKKEHDFISFKVEDLSKTTIKYLKSHNKPLLLWTIDINKYYSHIKELDANLIIKIEESDIKDCFN